MLTTKLRDKFDVTFVSRYLMASKRFLTLDEAVASILTSDEEAYSEADIVITPPDYGD